jgi:hypothetical protein
MRNAPVSDATIEALLRLAAAGGRERVSGVEADGQWFWIKRFNRDDRALYKVLHRLVAWMPLLPSLRPSPPVNAAGAVDREIRKSAQFAAAGFAVAPIVFSNANMVITRHVGDTVATCLDTLRLADAQAHDALLIRCAETLAGAHSCGLCHGRPHPRDMIMNDGVPGFMDFEEEPEAVMPLAIAQARDCWLMFLVLADLAITPETAPVAFARYRTLAPQAVTGELQHLVRFWHVLLNPVRRLRLSQPGADLRRLLKADAIFTGGSPAA